MVRIQLRRYRTVVVASIFGVIVIALLGWVLILLSGGGEGPSPDEEAHEVGSLV
jgi:uncharacterized YccA/Bax inhibitor family protein